MTDAELVGQLGELEVVALTIYGEARSERVEGRVAVGCVIRNRFNARKYGSDYKAVCLMPWQFSCWLHHDDDHRRNYGQLMAAARSLRADDLGPALKECEWIAGGIISSNLEDITRRSTHYITRKLWESKPPWWAMGRTPRIGIGSHVFFNDVDD